MLFLRKRKKYIAVDIGSHALKAAIFERQEGAGAPQNIEKLVAKFSPATKENRMIANVREAITGLLAKEYKPAKIIIAISPNIADISVQEWKVNPMHLRESLTPVHAQKYFQELFNEHREATHAFLGYPLAIEINGYPVDIKIFSVRDAALISELTLRTIMLRFSDEAGALFAELKQSLTGIEIEFVPLHAVEAEVLVKTCNIREGILVDAGATMTTLMFIHNGQLMQLSSFPIGTERFSHRIVKLKGGKFVEAEDLNRQYAQGLIAKDEQIAISHIFSEEAEEWKKGFIEALEVLYPIAPLPGSMYLFGGGAYLPELRSIVWSRDILKRLSSLESPHVAIVQAPQIFNNDPLQHVISGPEDAGLASLMYYSLYHTPLF